MFLKISLKIFQLLFFLCVCVCVLLICDSLTPTEQVVYADQVGIFFLMSS